MISIHALTRRAARISSRHLRDLKHFNPRSHEESGLFSFLSHTASSDFNPRSHEESGPSVARLRYRDFNFNPRSHEESGQNLNLSADTYKKFQSTLSRGERLLRLQCRADSRWISIHALTRRAACCDGTLILPQQISIHALTRRAALRPVPFAVEKLISIHALTRRAAPNKSYQCVVASYFNPRSHEESGKIHRRRHGAASNFNPRSHEESGRINK